MPSLSFGSLALVLESEKETVVFSYHCDQISNGFVCFHSGEVALPGGKREEGDANDVDTALREAREEIGLDPSHVTVITLLPPFTTKVIYVFV